MADSLENKKLQDRIAVRRSIKPNQKSVECHERKTSFSCLTKEQLEYTEPRRRTI